MSEADVWAPDMRPLCGSIVAEVAPKGCLRNPILVWVPGGVLSLEAKA